MSAHTAGAEEKRYCAIFFRLTANNYFIISYCIGVVNIAIPAFCKKAESAVFDREFRKDEDASDIYRTAEDTRELETDSLTEKLYFGVLDNLDETDRLISTRAVGWKTERMSKVSLSVLRIAVYEMKFCPETPFPVAINEAVELAKTFDDDKAPAFVNGILNGIAEDLGLKK